MKRNKTEQRIFEAADALTPEPPSFETVTQGVDWSEVARKTRSAKRVRWPVIVAAATAASLLIGTSIGLIVWKASSKQSQPSLRMAKSISLEEASDVVVPAEKLAFLSDFSEKAIQTVRSSNGTNSFAFSPLSYYLNLGAFYSLTSQSYEDSIHRLGASDQADLSRLVGDLSKRIFVDDAHPYHKSRIVSANLVADFASAFDQEGVQKITDDLYASYINDASRASEDLDSFISQTSDGAVATYPWEKPGNGKVSFLSCLYADVPYPYPFPERPMASLPFNGEGSYDYYRGDQLATGIVLDEEYVAFRMGDFRFVKPLSSSLADFFAVHPFHECFVNDDMQEYQITLTLPKVEVDSSLDLLGVAKGTGLCTEGSFVFADDTAPHDFENLRQDNHLEFSNLGVKAYSGTSSQAIPMWAPVAEIALDSPFAFEILGRDDIVLYYGEITSLAVH